MGLGPTVTQDQDCSVLNLRELRPLPAALAPTVTQELDRSVLNLRELRPLPIALAHRFCSAQFEDPYMETLKRLFAALGSRERSACRSEYARRSLRGACFMAAKDLNLAT